MTDDLLEPINQDPIHVGSAGTETHPEMKNVKSKYPLVLTGVAVLTGMVVATTATFVATRPEVSGLEKDLDTAAAALADSEDALERQTEATDKCVESSQLAAQSFTHWHNYMNDVQNVHLAESATAVDRAMDQLNASYRKVVEDKVPVNTAVKACVGGQ